MSQLFNKYTITKTDGSPVDPHAQYFVLRLDTDPHAREAMMAYLSGVMFEDPEFANELMKWLNQISAMKGHTR